MFKYLGMLVFVVSLMVLSACNLTEGSKTLATVDGKTITQNEFDAYLKFKRLPAADEKRKAKLLDQYLEKEALAAVIEKEAVLDKDMVSVELNEF